MGLFNNRDKPKHRSILNIKTTRTPTPKSSKKFSPDLTSLEFPVDTSMQKTKMLVDSSIEGQIERNAILEQQLLSLGEYTTRTCDELYSLKQANTKLQMELRSKNDELTRNSMSTMSTMNSMLSQLKTIETANTSIVEDEVPDKRITQLELQNKLQQVEIANLRKLLQARDEQIAALNKEQIDNLVQHKKNLSNFKNVIWQLQTNYDNLYYASI